MLIALTKPDIRNQQMYMQQPQSNADILLKYKQLYDAGAITKQEFESKKRELGFGANAGVPADSWRCPSCGNINRNHISTCRCGHEMPNDFS